MSSVLSDFEMHLPPPLPPCPFPHPLSLEPAAARPPLVFPSTPICLGHHVIGFHLQTPPRNPHIVLSSEAGLLSSRSFVFVPINLAIVLCRLSMKPHLHPLRCSAQTRRPWAVIGETRLRSLIAVIFMSQLLYTQQFAPDLEPLQSSDNPHVSSAGGSLSTPPTTRCRKRVRLQDMSGNIAAGRSAGA
ncbi:hypothetical protein R3P38DRAFT_3213568 [Favolaschia claudopus]|uniref:Uncharacterized protein n=1 Tax=Favolaschia claudopus TaxID=2862362 RepID=A0AAW0ACV8_9AGAR